MDVYTPAWQFRHSKSLQRLLRFLTGRPFLALPVPPLPPPPASPPPGDDLDGGDGGPLPLCCDEPSSSPPADPGDAARLPEDAELPPLPPLMSPT